MRAVVLLADLRTLDTASLPQLSATEQARHDAFVREERRRQFVLGRALARRAIGRVLQIDHRDLSLVERPGKGPAPLLAAGSAASLSISHSGPWVACAASASTAVGLDIEVADPARDVVALARQAFGDAEADALLALAPAARCAAFYTRWCGEEARIKLGAPPAGQYQITHPALCIVLASAHVLGAAPLLDDDPLRD